MDIRDIYQRLKVIKEKAKDMTEDSFDKTKAFKFVYLNLLDMLDTLEYLEEENELFDDNDNDLYDDEIDESGDLFGEIEDPNKIKFKQVISLEDLEDF